MNPLTDLDAESDIYQYLKIHVLTTEGDKME